MAVFLQDAIEICERFESEELEFRAIPYIDTKTGFLISPLTDAECDFVEWADCIVNNQSDWFGFRPDNCMLFALYLKNKKTGNIYYITS